MTFQGSTYNATLDKKRLKSQLECVEQLLSGGAWWTLSALVYALRKEYGLRASEASVSARLRDLRKPQHGGHHIEHRREFKGLWSYKMTPRTEPKQLELSV